MQMRNQGAIALGVVMITAIVFSVAAFAALTAANSRAAIARNLSGPRLKAAYAAEAGLVWAMQKLYADPTAFNSAGGSIDLPFDVNGDGAISGGEGVDIILAACAAEPCPDRALQAKVTY